MNEVIMGQHCTEQPEVSNDQPDSTPAILHLTLYVAGRAPTSARALANLRSICEQYFPGRFQLTVVDVLEDPLQAINSGVLVTPTLEKVDPPPVVRIVGDLSEKEKVLQSLNFGEKRQ